MHKCFLFSTYSPTLINNSYSDKCELISHCGFDLHFPDNRWLSAFFHVPIGHLYAFFEKMSIHTVCPFNWNVWFFDIELWLLWIVWMLTLYWTYCLQIFPSFSRWPFLFVDKAFCKSFLVWYNPTSLFLLLFSLPEETYPKNILPMFSSIGSMVLGAFKFLISFEFIFVHGVTA